MAGLSRRLFLCVAGGASAQEPRITAAVTLVRVDTEVLHEGRMVEGLGVSDFIVLDEGARQPVLNISQELEPLDVMLLFDVSGSMSWVVRAAAEAAEKTLAVLREGDRAGVMVFSAWSEVVQPLTEVLSDVVSAVRGKVMKARFGGETQVMAAIDSAGRALAKGARNRRRAVLLVTDNLGTPGKRESTVLRQLWESDVIVSAIITPPDGSQPQLWSRPFSRSAAPIPEQRVDTLVEQTGGSLIASSEPGNAMEAMMERLRSRYTLYYRMPEARRGERRRIEVRLSTEVAQRYPGAVIRARGGYNAPRAVE